MPPFTTGYLGTAPALRVGGSVLHPSSDWGDWGQGDRDEEAAFSLGDVLGEWFALVFFSFQLVCS